MLVVFLGVTKCAIRHRKITDQAKRITVISEINRKNFPYRAIGGALALYDL